MIKIKNEMFKVPSQFLDYLIKNPALKKNDNIIIHNKRLSIAKTAYGWFWVDEKYASYSDEFFSSKEEAKKDLDVFRDSN